jgi:hypothetical protein
VIVVIGQGWDFSSPKNSSPEPPVPGRREASFCSS